MRISKNRKEDSITIPSTSSAVSSVVSKVLSVLEESLFEKDDIFAVHLALEEALVNAINHGNKMDSQKEVAISYSVDQDVAEISVTDQGNGFSPGYVPDPRCGENLYKAGGRGLFLIKSYMDKIDFNEKGNCICMVKRRSKNKQIGGKD
ncbi:MAG: ATP-binding protein [Phycisphaerae bacterium]|nr:ATP-binding protein [Phycisphaerae bacterium]